MEKKKTSDLLSRLIASIVFVATLSTSSSAVEAAFRGPGSCGQYMYWRAGKCLDARNKPGAHWTKTMLDSNFSSFPLN